MGESGMLPAHLAGEFAPKTTSAFGLRTHGYSREPPIKQGF